MYNITRRNERYLELIDTWSRLEAEENLQITKTFQTIGEEIQTLLSGAYHCPIPLQGPEFTGPSCFDYRVD
jgi:hypothetical protein